MNSKRYFVNPDFIRGIWFATLEEYDCFAIAHFRDGRKENVTDWDREAVMTFVNQKRWIEVKKEELPFW